jgi:tRNA(Ile)-lysidine synthase
LKNIDNDPGGLDDSGARVPNTAMVFSLQSLADVLRRLDLSSATPLKIAFSGGLDSHVLLHALCQLRGQMSLDVSAVHVDHGLQPSSHSWTRHCALVCAQLDVPFVSERIQVTDIKATGLEAAARAARYACLARHVAADAVLLTGQHLDDQAETVLLQLLRGTGVPGLSAMPEITRFSKGRMARPLLGFTRAQLLAYATQEKLQWIDDASNEDARFSRNYLRHRVFPLLESRWPGSARQIARTAYLAAETSGLLDVLAESDWHLCRLQNAAALSVTALRQLPPPRQRNLIRHWLRTQGFLPPTAMNLEQVLVQIQAEPRSRQSVVRWPEAEVRRYRDEMIALRPEPVINAALKLPWNPVEPLKIPGVGLLRAVSEQGVGLSQERIGKSLLTVGWRQGGEVCRLPGRTHRHKLKKLLQEAGVPPWERSRLPLIYVNDKLAAIGDRWVCEPYAAHKHEAGWKLELKFMQKSDGPQ